MRPEELRDRQARTAATDEELTALAERELRVIGRRLGSVVATRRRPATLSRSPRL